MRLTPALAKFPVLSSEETLSLAIQAKEDRGAARLLALHNMRLVVKCCNGYTVQRDNEPDFFQAGVIGLLGAIRTFDATKGVPFPSHAATHIRGALCLFILENAHIAKVGTSVQQRKVLWNAAKYRAKIEQEEGSCTNERLAEVLGVKEQDIDLVQQAMSSKSSVPFDVPLGAEGRTIGETFNDESPSAEDNLDKTQQIAMIQKLILSDYVLGITAEMSPKKKELAAARRLIIENHMLKDKASGQWTLEQCSVALQLTRQRVQQLTVEIQERLKTAFFKEM